MVSIPLPRLFFPIHLNRNRSIKTYMTKIFRLLYGRLRIQERLIEPTISLKWINRKNSPLRTKSGSEEMGTFDSGLPDNSPIRTPRSPVRY